MHSLKKIILVAAVANFSLSAWAQYSVFGDEGENSYNQEPNNPKNTDADDALNDATPTDQDDAFLEDDYGGYGAGGDAEVYDAEVLGNSGQGLNSINDVSGGITNNPNGYGTNNGGNGQNGGNNLYNNQSQSQNNVIQADTENENNQLNQQNNSQAPGEVTDFAPQQVETQQNAMQQNTQINANPMQENPQTMEAPVLNNETGFETKYLPPEVEFSPSSRNNNVIPMATDTPAPPVSTLPQPNEFSGAPPLPGSRRDMAEGEAPIEYTVQPGDTLFDICDQLLDEPYYWPKLWSFNPQIKNPHFIYPGMVLKFYTGNANQPPYMEVVESDEELPIDRGDLNAAELVAQQDVPSVLDTVEQVSGDDLNQPMITADELNMEGSDGYFVESGKIYSDPTIHLTIPSFIFSEQKETLGEVVGGAEGHNLSGAEDNVIIKSDVGLSPTTTYSVIRKGSYIKEAGTKEGVGYFYEYVGNIQVEKKLNTDPLYLSKVLREDLEKGIRQGDLLIPYVSTKRQISDKNDFGRFVTLEGATILTFDQPNSEYGGRGNFVFINRGSGQLAEGDAVKLYTAYGHDATKDLAHLYPPVDQDFQYIGIARIVNVSDAAALGYIMEASRELRVGDPAGR